ncbi:MAG: YqjF family protein [Akkermansiaceae bacterium]
MSIPTEAQRLAERQPPHSPVVMKQDWAHLLFLHWEIEPEKIQDTLPPGLSVDTHQDKAYLGLVPFFMERIRPAYCPAVPGISWFQELNFRTYVHDEQGRPGVWFYALECNQWLAVKIARRLFHLPYQHAKMASSKNKGTLTYSSKRKGCDQLQTFQYPAELSHSKTSEQGTLEFFLLERYKLFSADKNGIIHSGVVHHKPYQFQEVEITDYSTKLFSLCGFEEPNSPPVSSLIAETVSVDIHPLKKN